MTYALEGSQPLVEPVPVDDDLCSRLALIEDLGFAARFVLVQDQTCFEARAVVSVVKRRIVMPYEVIPQTLDMCADFMARRASQAAARMLNLIRR